MAKRRTALPELLSPAGTMECFYAAVEAEPNQEDLERGVENVDGLAGERTESGAQFIGGEAGEGAGEELNNVADGPAAHDHGSVAHHDENGDAAKDTDDAPGSLFLATLCYCFSSFAN